MKVLVTGGAGYIGSHTCVQMLAAGMEPVVVDNLSNSKEEALRRVERIAGRAIVFYRADIRDKAALREILARHPVEAVVHFAGLKAVGESVAQPLRYYDNNVAGTVTLCEAMLEAGVKRIVFSSSATVYGDPHAVPIREDFPAGATTNPYGRSKFMIEEILRDLHVADPTWRIALLRYFNPVGAHESGLIGEDPNDIPNNLMPYIAQVAVGRRPHLNVFGNDYPTPDGTGVRDYIHVVDLAEGHVAALRYLDAHEGVVTVNLGTGRGYSVLDMVRAFSAASGREIPYRIAPRRPGDVACCYADPTLAERLFGWRAKRGIEQMCADTWRWQSMNPQGYGD
ncbi:MAG: UDP-glucose 4-epimerase GalE [Thiobacillaceae bacterium]